MKQKLRKVILKYQKYLKQGEENLMYLANLERPSQENILRQRQLNTMWRMVIKDFQDLAEEQDNDFKKK